jgi:hypothetical protein
MDSELPSKANFTLDDLKSTSSSKKSNKSTKSSSSKRNMQAKPQQEVQSDEISISQLEMMANRKKLVKKEEVSLSDMIKKEADSVPPVNQKNVKQIESSSSSSSSTSTVTSMSSEKQRQKVKRVSKENRDDIVRKEKSEMLYKFSKLNIKQKWSSLKLDMNNSLEEIKNEYERVRSEIQNERSVGFYKRMLLLGVQGVEMLNTKFDPVGVDLDGWSEAMGYSLENQDYDELMAELVEKYKGAGQMSPEVKLVFMIISSATMFSVSKRIAKLDTSSAFTNILGTVLGGGGANQMQQQPVFNPPPQFQQAPQQTYNAPLTETSDDPMPSKLREPAPMPADTMDIENILKTMNARKESQAREQQAETDSEELFRSIPLNTQKRGRGRPKKTQVMKS